MFYVGGVSTKKGERCTLHDPVGGLLSLHGTTSHTADFLPPISKIRPFVRPPIFFFGNHQRTDHSWTVHGIRNMSIQPDQIMRVIDEALFGSCESTFVEYRHCGGEVIGCYCSPGQPSFSLNGREIRLLCSSVVKSAK